MAHRIDEVGRRRVSGRRLVDDAEHVPRRLVGVGETELRVEDDDGVGGRVEQADELIRHRALTHRVGDVVCGADVTAHDTVGIGHGLGVEGDPRFVLRRVTAERHDAHLDVTRRFAALGIDPQRFGPCTFRGSCLHPRGNADGERCTTESEPAERGVRCRQPTVAVGFEAGDG